MIAKVKVAMTEIKKIRNIEEHRRLATIIKSVHADLRNKLRANNGDFEAVWSRHCQDQHLLSLYAETMRTLAQNHWSNNSQSRINWCQETITEYFHGGGLKKVLEKQAKNKKIAAKIFATSDDKTLPEKVFLHQDALHVSFTDDRSGSEEENLQNILRRNSSVFTDVATKTINIMCQTANVCCSTDLTTLPISRNADEQCLEITVANLTACRTRERRKTKENDDADTRTETELPWPGRMRLLDVGSCYNPFRQFPQLLSVGIDISPATESVLQCDFLKLRLAEPVQEPNSASLDSFLLSLNSPVESLPSGSFHVVVFCLLLEYLPAGRQRWQCCLKAHHLLQSHGLLLIVTPDSHSQHRNAPMMRSWKRGIEAIGFSRWRYVKQEHLHCMAFRKLQQTCHPSQCPQDHMPSLLDVALVEEEYSNMIYIPQDFSEFHPDGHDGEKKEASHGQMEDADDRKEFFEAALSELPDFFSSEHFEER